MDDYKRKQYNNTTTNQSNVGDMIFKMAPFQTFPDTETRPIAPRRVVEASFDLEAHLIGFIGVKGQTWDEILLSVGSRASIDDVRLKLDQVS